MKRQDITALHQLSLTELASKLGELEKEYGLAKLELAAGKRKNTHIRLISDQIARIKTIMTEKQLAAVSQKEKQS